LSNRVFSSNLTSMPVFNFDRVINRFNTDSVRWDKYDSNVIPLWVADMDFASPPCIVDALKERMNHEIFGYSHSPEGLKQDIVAYLQDQFNWQIEPDWIVFVPSLVSSLYSLANNITSPKAHILTLQPVYHHILNAAKNSGRDYSAISLTNTDYRLALNPEAILRSAKSNSELIYFCNPHNPGGTVYSFDELSQIAKACEQENLIICSDEIHCGMVYPGKKHIPIASVSEYAAERTITLMSMNKTFNIPGAGLAWFICKNNDLRKKASKDLGTTIPDPQIFTYIATRSALQHGEPWRHQLMDYLEGNRQLLSDAMKNLPQLSLYKMEASYLGWISCQNLNVEDPGQLFLKSGVALQPGAMFQQNDHVRINIATPKTILNEALDRMRLALSAM
jgi:cystathionine beta-lyase